MRSVGQCLRSCVAVAALLAACAPAWAQDADQGRSEFLAHCAGCHGADGKGDGPRSATLSIKPADLTTLAKRNNGMFAPGLVYQLIDGRNARINHRSTAMPIWGCRHEDPQAQAPPAAIPHGRAHAKRRLPRGDRQSTLESLLDLPCDSDTMIQDRILAIVGYLSLIQER